MHYTNIFRGAFEADFSPASLFLCPAFPGRNLKADNFNAVGNSFPEIISQFEFHPGIVRDRRYRSPARTHLDGLTLIRRELFRSNFNQSASGTGECSNLRGGREKEEEAEKNDGASWSFSNSGGLNRALGFNGKRTFLLASSLKFQVTRLMDTRFARDYSRPCN